MWKKRHKRSYELVCLDMLCNCCLPSPLMKQQHHTGFSSPCVLLPIIAAPKHCNNG